MKNWPNCVAYSAAKESSLNLADKSLQLDSEGYLLFPDEWDTAVAVAMAERINVDLNEERWTVVRFVRDYYEANQSVPEARFTLRAMKEKLGKDKGTRKYLYYLFPYGYAQQACKIAGMRKPLKLMLDL